MPTMVMYHATTAEAAKSIERSRRFLPGKRGYAGAAIYFASERADAIAHSFNGAHYDSRKQATVVITCKVDLGTCMIAKKHEVDKCYCDANGFDSVRIKGTTTHAVYDYARIVIQEFTHAANSEPWLLEKKERKKHVAPALTSKGALCIVIAAIQKATSKSLDASTDMASLYTKHAGLREAIASKSLKAFCESHTELRWSKGCISLSVLALTSKDALAILIAEIRASPSKALNASTDMASLYLKHAGLQEAIPSKGLKAFCESHTGVIWKHGKISLAQVKSTEHPTPKAVKILLAQEIARSQVQLQCPRYRQRKLLAQLQHEDEYAKQRSCFQHECDAVRLSLLRPEPSQCANASTCLFHMDEVGQRAQRAVAPTSPTSPLEMVATLVVGGVSAGLGCLGLGCTALSSLV
jgi:hypothetical protein